MPSGFRVDSSAWLRDYEEAKTLSLEIVQLIQERNTNAGLSAPDASRKTVAARRKVSTLGTDITKLLKALDDTEGNDLSEHEKNRRRDMVHELRNRREQLLLVLKRSQGANERDMLLLGISESLAPRETEATAELDTRGLLALQDRVMKQQDEELDQLERGISNTKHVALAIGEEVDLHTRLLEELEEDVDVTQSRLRAATTRIREVMRNTSTFRLGLCIFILTVTLVLLALIVLKVIKLVG